MNKPDLEWPYAKATIQFRPITHLPYKERMKLIGFRVRFWIKQFP